MEKDKVYISGAIAHYNIDERKGAFANAEQNLRNMGFSPVNPFKNGLPDEAHWREHMRADIALLLLHIFTIRNILSKKRVTDDSATNIMI